MNSDEINKQQEEGSKSKPSSENSALPESEKDVLELETKASSGSDVANDQVGIVGRTPG